MTRILDSRLAYDGYAKVTVLTVEEADGATHHLEVVSRGEAACVLPYDPDRKVALTIRVSRAPLLKAGVAAPLIEAPAGMVDAGETAQATARREAEEEAGVALRDLEPVCVAWSSPGVLDERIHLFLAPYGAADRVAAGGGLADEHEDIAVVEAPLAELWRLCQAGEVADLKTFALIVALRARQPALF
ncbi:MAG TPA: NUDIX hydrolase [Caulobacteraceae bacterium]|jgi:nudix-type nucleoside diphosphatase (YffH/AdpP family)